jgi:hypothetical protein
MSKVFGKQGRSDRQASFEFGKLSRHLAFRLKPQIKKSKKRRFWFSWTLNALLTIASISKKLVVVYRFLDSSTWVPNQIIEVSGTDPARVTLPTTAAAL